MKIRGTKIFDRPITNIEARNNKPDYYGANVENLTLESIIGHYLCEGLSSECVVKGRCEVLDCCQYGQRYILLMKGRKAQHGRIRRKD